jgi:hypothetical protein
MIQKHQPCFHQQKSLFRGSSQETPVIQMPIVKKKKEKVLMP